MSTRFHRSLTEGKTGKEKEVFYIFQYFLNYESGKGRLRPYLNIKKKEREEIRENLKLKRSIATLTDHGRRGTKQGKKRKNMKRLVARPPAKKKTTEDYEKI